MQCIKEVTANQRFFHRSQHLPGLDHGVYKSDTIVPLASKIALKDSLIRLERLRREEVGKHHTGPELFIVDPCLYPLCFGLTKYYSSAMSSLESSIRLSGKGRSNRSLLSPEVNGSLNERWSYKIENAWSTRYQWLPCDISFDKESRNAQYAASFFHYTF